jgi:hypothetical protein
MLLRENTNPAFDRTLKNRPRCPFSPSRRIAPDLAGRGRALARAELLAALVLDRSCPSAPAVLSVVAASRVGVLLRFRFHLS